MPPVKNEELRDLLEDTLASQRSMERLLLKLIRVVGEMHIQGTGANQASQKSHVLEVPKDTPDKQ